MKKICGNKKCGKIFLSLDTRQIFCCSNCKDYYSHYRTPERIERRRQQNKKYYQKNGKIYMKHWFDAHGGYTNYIKTLTFSNDV